METIPSTAATCSDPIPMESRTLLIIDDCAEDRVKAISLIRCDTSCHYQAVEAGTITEALAALVATPPDCVLLDPKLPDGTGLDFLLNAGDDQKRLPFPVIVFTDSGDLESAVALMKAGALDYLIKSTATADSIRLAVNNAIHQTHNERRIEEQRVELERLYAEARVHNDALRVANTTKDDFLAMLSHELRTPLTPVLSLVTSTINDRTLPTDLRDVFLMIQRNVELEARLIDDLLDLTQITSGRLKIEAAPVDLHHCIEAAIDVCHEGFAEKRLVIRTDLKAEQSIVQGEFARLNQVFWNLLKNAIKFTRPHGHVQIITRNEDNHILVEIRDDGLGIDPERLSSVFGTFQPIKPQPTDTGIGLGLAITRAIIEGHGGGINAESAGKDQGAVFRIRLPISSSAPESIDATPPTRSTTVRHKTILVVEDHDDTRRVLSRVLRRKGFGVTAAGSVAAAVEQFTTTPADLIICDIGLPDGTGWDLMKKLHAFGRVRAIAVSGYGMDDDVRKSRDAGFLKHLTKPINVPNLEHLIVETLKAEAR